MKNGKEVKTFDRAGNQFRVELDDASLEKISGGSSNVKASNPCPVCGSMDFGVRDKSYRDGDVLYFDIEIFCEGCGWIAN
ncbi:MAG: hypothetical protein K5886_03140 [Lachnospiraceae bacterium]|nr:hypothetical protein [Lachnospiraceae bacterium]